MKNRFILLSECKNRYFVVIIISICYKFNYSEGNTYISLHSSTFLFYYKMVVFTCNTYPSTRLNSSLFYVLLGMKANLVNNKTILINENVQLTK